MSILGLLNLMCLKGQELEAVLWPVSRGDDVEQSFVLRLGKSLLRIFDAGDELGVEVIANSVRSHRLTQIIGKPSRVGFWRTTLRQAFGRLRKAK